MISRGKFFAAFLLLAFVMKVIGELVHEVMGHGLFVLLFGGKIIQVHISLFWPYELSYIMNESPPAGFEAWQLIWITGGGILVCLIVSFTLQMLLLLKIRKDWRLSTSLFWLSFWTFLNPTGYLIIGGIRPFGDVASLIANAALTQTTSLLVGLLIFFVAFFSISEILIKLLLNVGIIRDAKESRVFLSLFWLVIPIVTATYCLGTRQPLPYWRFSVAVSFTPVLVASIIPTILTRLRLWQGFKQRNQQT